MRLGKTKKIANFDSTTVDPKIYEFSPPVRLFQLKNYRKNSSDTQINKLTTTSYLSNPINTQKFKHTKKPWTFDLFKASIIPEDERKSGWRSAADNKGGVKFRTEH